MPRICTSLAPAGDLRSEEGAALVDACHARYCEALQALYDAHKDRWGCLGTSAQCFAAFRNERSNAADARETFAFG